MEAIITIGIVIIAASYIATKVIQFARGKLKPCSSAAPQTTCERNCQNCNIAALNLDNHSPNNVKKT
jgi:hypothetical protein